MPEYLQYFPAPFLEDLVQGRCLPIVGSGMSLNAKLPAGKKMLHWEGVGRKIAGLLPEYRYTTALEALSTYEHEFSRATLVEFLMSSLHTSTIQPGTAHDEFCSIPFNRVVSTNWDFLLEAAYARMSKYCIPMVSEEQLAVSNSEVWVKLLKLHGDLNHPTRMVVTEEDYDGFLARYPLLATYLSSMLIDSTALFIGYSLDDPDFRQIWQIVKDRLGGLRRPAYSVQIGAAHHVVSRFERRGVKVINLPKSKQSYNDVLTVAFRELREYWADKLPLMSTSADSESQLDLALPALVQSRLAFFAVPTYAAAFYKRTVYPIAEKHGFSPVMAVDVLAPGDNIMAKVQALLEKSAVMVVDLDSPNAAFEAGLALSDDRFMHRLIVIADDRNSVPSELRMLPIIIREWSWVDDDELIETQAFNSFTDQLSAQFAKAYSEISPTLNDEPKRLLSKNEYRAAVLASFSLLEHELRAALDPVSWSRIPPPRGPLSIRAMLTALSEQLGPELSAKLSDHLVVRNGVAHTSEPVNVKLATDIVNDVGTAIAKLKASG